MTQNHNQPETMVTPQKQLKVAIYKRVARDPQMDTTAHRIAVLQELEERRAKAAKIAWCMSGRTLPVQQSYFANQLCEPFEFVYWIAS